MTGFKLDTGSRWFLLNIGSESAVHLEGVAREAAYPTDGLVLALELEDGSTARLEIIAPKDLWGFADWQAVGLIKPFCLPLQLTQIAPGRIRANLRDDALARDLAQAVLNLIHNPKNPASIAPVSLPTNAKSKGETS
ncbi:MAG: hypothetical protein K0U74_12155 [Alphaproteobacteria bacterium]|nr:hypothetical protein [Alphaproteobacteria bacterium]